MKIYCFIEDDKIGIYDRENWKEQGKDIRLTSLKNSLGETITKEFIDYVVFHYIPKENLLLKDHPNTFMYEVDL